MDSLLSKHCRTAAEMMRCEEQETALTKIFANIWEVAIGLSQSNERSIAAIENKIVCDEDSSR